MSRAGAATSTGVALVLACLVGGPARGYEVNGKHWDSMPIPYYVNVASAPDFGDGSSAFDVVQSATEIWHDVGCADASFLRLGDTTAGFEADGQNTIFWIKDVWPFGDAAAGATLWIPTEEGQPYEVDLALNAVNFEWTVGGADATVTDVVDPTSVIAHELGHWLGLAHTADVHATMYQAMLPNAAQTTLAGDDKLAICTIYPSGVAECANDWDCGGGYACTTTDDVTYCDELRDPVGAPCSKTHLNCADMCLISFYECTTVCAYETGDLSKGYCAPLCTGGLPCPDGWTCTHAPAVDQDVCLQGGGTKPADPDPELTPHEDAGAWPDAAAVDVVEAVEVLGGDGGDGGGAASDTGAPGVAETVAPGQDSTAAGGDADGGGHVAQDAGKAGSPSAPSGADGGCGAAPGRSPVVVALLALVVLASLRRLRPRPHRG